MKLAEALSVMEDMQKQLVLKIYCKVSLKNQYLANNNSDILLKSDKKLNFHNHV